VRFVITNRTVLLGERSVIRIAAIAPAALVLLSIVVLLIAVARYEPLWTNRDVSLTEAAHDGDIAAVFRMVSAGADPNRAEAVPFEHRPQPVLLTPLEAGVESRQVEVLQVLVKAGALPDEPERQRLACLAMAVDASEVASYLRSALPPLAEPDCSRMPLPEH
jgi:hypothetical protein